MQPSAPRAPGDLVPDQLAPGEPVPGELAPEQLQRLRPDRVLDSTGEVCPYPVKQALDALKELAPGSILVQLTDHSMSTQTVPFAVRRSGLARVLGITGRGGVYRIYMKRL